MVMKEKIQKCGTTCHKTHINKIILCPRKGGDVLKPAIWDSDFPMDTIVIHSQLGHAHLTTNMMMYERFPHVQQGLCELEWKVQEIH